MSQKDTTIRIPAELNESAEELSHKIRRVRKDEFFAPAFVLSNGLSKTAVLKWAMQLGLNELNDKYRDALLRLYNTKRVEGVESAVDAEAFMELKFDDIFEYEALKQTEIATERDNNKEQPGPEQHES